MAEHVTEKDVRDIATYTRIGMTDEEVAAMTVDLNNIIDGGLVNVMRGDVEQTSFSQETALENAPKQEDDCFLIPAILGGGE